MIVNYWWLRTRNNNNNAYNVNNDGEINNNNLNNTNIGVRPDSPYLRDNAGTVSVFGALR